MKFSRVTSVILRTLLWITVAILALVAGVLLLLYSGWGQDIVRRKALEYINRQPGMSARVDYLRIHFPLDIDLAGVELIQRGDTMVSADSISASVRLLPLLGGHVDVSSARLRNGYYQLGNADSTLWMRVRADQITLRPASVALTTMDIDVGYGRLSRATVDMVLRQDTTPSPPSQQQTMAIRLGCLDIDRLTYRMSMMPTIDSLAATIGAATLRDGRIDLAAQTIRLHALDGSALDVAYIAPDAATAAQYPQPVVAPADTTPSRPWTIEIDTIDLMRSRALYTTRGATPQPGLDPGYIQVDSMDLRITDFYNQASNIRLPLILTATERCGVRLTATGTFALDSAAMYLDDMHITTPVTDLTVQGMMGMGQLLSDPTLPLRLRADGHIGFGDLGMMFPIAQPYLRAMPRDGSAGVTVDISGTPARLAIDQMRIALTRTATIEAHGAILNMTDPERLGGDITLTGRVIDIKSLVNTLVSPSTPLAIPPLTLNGDVHMHGRDISGKLRARTLGGRLALDARYKRGSEGYRLRLDADRFPVAAFMPSLGVGDATLTLTADGQGLDMMSDRTDMDVNARVTSLTYNGYEYRDINLEAALHHGMARATAEVHNADIDVRVVADGNLAGSTYNWNARVDGDNIDLMALKLTQTPLQLSVDMDAQVRYTPSTNSINASANLIQLDYNDQSGMEFGLSNVNAHMMANDSLIDVSLINRDLLATVTVPYGVDSLMTHVDSFMALVDEQLSGHTLSIDTLQQTMPRFVLDVKAGNNNLINDILASQKVSVNHLTLSASNQQRLSMNAQALSVVDGSVRLDTVSLKLTQMRDKLNLTATVDNRPGNMDQFAHIRLNGLLGSDNISVRVTQSDATLQTGYDLGAIATYADSTLTARLFPLTPTIGYKKWSVNVDNYLKYNIPHHHIDANLKMKGAGSSLQLYTDHHHEAEDHEAEDLSNNVTLKIDDIQLADWISFNPFAPPITGSLSANINANWDGGDNINGAGTVSLNDFYYNRHKVASLQVDADVQTNINGRISASGDLLVDGDKVLTLSGALNDSDNDSPLNLDMSMIQFPLSIANPFLPEDIASLSGALNGRMTMSGRSDSPRINGSLNFDRTAIRLPMTNTSYAFSSVAVPITDNVVYFNDFNIRGASDNALYVNGTVDLHSLMSPRYNLSMRARDFMLVNTNKASKGATIYGKATVNLDAKAAGNLSFMDLDANLTVLAGTNVTYIMTQTTNDITSKSTENLVKFVNLSDSTAVAAADTLSSQSMLMAIDAQLTIETGTTVTVDLPTSSRDKVQVQASGTVNYTQAPMSEGRVMGRVNINNGFARYTIPVVGAEKTFNFDQGSYIAFNGDMLDPTLNIHATDVVKANVTQQGQNSRLANFDIMLAVTGTLSQMDVSFDLSTDDDLTVANELQSMSPDQRANQAMNMLLYNMYTGANTSASANLAGNPLFSFLESQINNWAANNIKGVDLSFGIDQYNQTTNGATSSKMTYSYQVSKTLFNDRFKIVVGGNYSTDTNADENIAENLINDISFEYFLNQQQTMVLRIFRHTGYESILEGEIVQTGVGFQYRRKLDRLARMLPKFMRPHLN